LIPCSAGLPNGEDAQGEKMQDGIRRGLGYAMQWYDTARLALEDRLDSAVRAGARAVLEKRAPSGETVVGMGAVTSCKQPEENQVSKLPDQCAELLQKRCPACFGGNSFGRPLNE
jgi:hypothetical protein